MVDHQPRLALVHQRVGDFVGVGPATGRKPRRKPERARAIVPAGSGRDHTQSQLADKRQQRDACGHPRLASGGS